MERNEAEWSAPIGGRPGGDDSVPGKARQRRRERRVARVRLDRSALLNWARWLTRYAAKRRFAAYGCARRSVESQRATITSGFPSMFAAQVIQ